MAEGVYGGQCIEKHAAVIYDRGGMRRIGPLLDLTSVRWERTRDGVSEAIVRVDGDACVEQSDFLASLATHRHELVIFRGGQRVWEGPIHRLAWHGTYVEVVAHDVIEYLMNTPLTQTWSNANDNVEPVATRIGRIILYEMTHGRQQVADDGLTYDVPAWESLTPPANVTEYLEIHNFVNEAKTAMVTYPFEMTVGEHLQSLARYQGIDFTAVGRAIHIWDVSRALGRTQQLTEENFLEEIIVTEYGADHAQAAYVLGNPPPDSKVPVYGSALAPENLDFYGPWTKVFTPYNEDGTDNPLESELNSQAQRNLAGRTPSPVEVRIPDNSAVLLSDAITIDDLVPGVQVPLRATLSARQFSQMQKIDHVTVTETAANGETIQLTLVPTTKPDADEELPDDEDQVSGLFPLNSNYRLYASAMDHGNSYVVKAVVYRLGGKSTGVAGAGTYTLSGERIEGTNVTQSGAWDFNFDYYKQKTVATLQIDDAAAGFRDFSVTVDMGGGVGSLTLNGTVEIS